MSGAIPPRPRMTEMSFWTKPAPMRKPKTKTDHWSKLKLQHNISGEFGDNGDYQYSTGAVSLSWDPATTLQSHKEFSYRPNDPFIDSLQNSTKPKMCLPPIKTAYSQRAKDGFRFWLIEKPAPTNFGKYGLGSYKTVLGIGNAPRT